MGGRLEVRITPADVGKRVSVRRVVGVPGEDAKFTDTVGVLTSWDGGVLSVTTKSGGSVRIAESSLVAGKVVPAPRHAAAVPPPPSVNSPWSPRAPGSPWRANSWATGGCAPPHGFTRRANSVLPLGDPGLPLGEALGRVRRWYEDRGLPAYVQAATGAEGTQERLCAGLEEHGWRREVSAEVRIAALAPVGDLDADVSAVRTARQPDDAWLSRYQRSGTPGPHVRAVLGSGPSVWFASVPGDGPAGVPHGDRALRGGRPLGGLHGRRGGSGAPAPGLATAVMTALARTALDEGASAAWLQVESDNEGARALYDRMGFATHHRYHHFRSA